MGAIWRRYWAGGGPPEVEPVTKTKTLASRGRFEAWPGPGHARPELMRRRNVGVPRGTERGVGASRSTVPGVLGEWWSDAPDRQSDPDAPVYGPARTVAVVRLGHRLQAPDRRGEQADPTRARHRPLSTCVRRSHGHQAGGGRHRTRGQLPEGPGAQATLTCQRPLWHRVPRARRRGTSAASVLPVGTFEFRNVRSLAVAAMLRASTGRKRRSARLSRAPCTRCRRGG